MRKLLETTKLYIFISCIVGLSAAADVCRFGGCTPTSESNTALKPGKYPSYNDITRSAGQFKDVYTKRILLRGIVVDKNCVPVSNAKILLWQKDEYGKRRYLGEFASDYDKYEMDNKIYSEFKGAGSATSDNEGRFYFITVDPSSDSQEHDKSVINISSTVEGFIPFQTQLKLKGLNSKKKDAKATGAIFNKSASAHYGKKVYDFFIVLNGKSKYTRY